MGKKQKQDNGWRQQSQKANPQKLDPDFNSQQVDNVTPAKVPKPDTGKKGK